MKIAAVSWLRVDPATRPGFVLLTHDWSILLTDGRWVLVRAGFWCDGASIPALARPWLSPIVCLALGVAHDFAVREGALIRHEGGAVEPFTVATGHWAPPAGSVSPLRPIVLGGQLLGEQIDCTYQEFSFPITVLSISPCLLYPLVNIDSGSSQALRHWL